MIKKAYSLFLSGSALMIGTYAASLNAAATPIAQDMSNALKESPAQEQADLQKLSEAFGHFIGRNLNTTGISFNLDLLIKGIKDGAAGKPAPMDDAAYEQLLNKFLAKAFLNNSNKNLKSANDFMTENKNKAGVITKEDGKLQYQILEKGHGPAVKEDGTPQIHYTGKYLDGKVFDDSRKRGEPIAIPIQNTIPGFRKGITGMQEGEKRRIFIHPDIGYGTQGNLPPNSLLIFDIEVIKADASKPEENKADIKANTHKDSDDDLSFNYEEEDYYYDHNDSDSEDDDFPLPQW